jgi:hypothetical protein
MAFLVEKPANAAGRRDRMVWELRKSVWVAFRLAAPLIIALTKEVPQAWGFWNKNIFDDLKL